MYSDWFRDENDFEGRSFIHVLLEMGPAHPAGHASIGYLANIRDIGQTRAEQAGLIDPGGFASSFHLLMKGSTISAAEGRRRRSTAGEIRATTCLPDTGPAAEGSQ